MDWLAASHTRAPEASPVRSTIHRNHDLFPQPLADTRLAAELGEIDRVIDGHPEWVELVRRDFTAGRGVSGRVGRPGMRPAAVLRLGIALRRYDVSLRSFYEQAADSILVRQFLGLGSMEPLPKRSTLQDNLSKIRPETWGKILHGVVTSTEAREFEDGKKVRVDCTVTETNVHHPTDSSLLWDCLRLTNRLLKHAQLRLGVGFDRRWFKQAKRHRIKLNFARSQVARLPHYKQLVVLAATATEQARAARRQLKVKIRNKKKQDSQLRAYVRLVARVEDCLNQTARVVDQTRRRVFEREKVPVEDKVFSIFESHTDLIQKGKISSYGHKLVLTTGATGMLLDLVIERGNPADAKLAIRQLERVKALFGEAPHDAVFDGGFASRDNFDDAKGLGVKRCVFSKGKGLTPEEMAGSRRTYGRLKNFRAGVEGNISHLKRKFGLRRCTWKGWEHFKSFVWSGALAFNLTKLAWLRLAKAKEKRRAA